MGTNTVCRYVPYFGQLLLLLVAGAGAGKLPLAAIGSGTDAGLLSVGRIPYLVRTRRNGRQFLGGCSSGVVNCQASMYIHTP